MEGYDLNLPADVVVNGLIQSAGEGDVRLSINTWREYVVEEGFVPERVDTKASAYRRSLRG